MNQLTWAHVEAARRKHHTDRDLVNEVLDAFVAHNDQRRAQAVGAARALAADLLDLDMGDMAVLATLNYHGPTSLAGLSRQLAHHPRVASSPRSLRRRLDPLQAAGHVTRSSAGLWQITTTGRQALTADR